MKFVGTTERGPGNTENYKTAEKCRSQKCFINNTVNATAETTHSDRR